MANTTADKLALAAANKVAIKAAIAAKNPATAPTDVMSQWPTAIASIPTGGSGWVPPEDWPDIYGILAADEKNYTGKCIVLFDNTRRNETISLSGAQAYLTSDGDFYVSSSAFNHAWHDDGYNGYRWVIFYTNEKFGNIAPNEQFNTAVTKAIVSNETSVFGTSFTCYYHRIQELLDIRGNEGIINTRDTVLKKIACNWPKGSAWGNHMAQSQAALVDLSFFGDDNISNCYGAFSNDSSLTKVLHIPPITDCNSCSQMFDACSSLIQVPEILDVSKCTNCSYMFRGCKMLKSVPEVIDLSSCTTCSSMFGSCFSLKRAPTHLTANGENGLSISFGNSSMIDPDSVAVIENGVVKGGMAFNLNDLTGSPNPPTVTFHENLKTAFGTNWEVVKAAFTSKGWNVSPA